MQAIPAATRQLRGSQQSVCILRRSPEQRRTEVEPCALLGICDRHGDNQLPDFSFIVPNLQDNATMARCNRPTMAEEEIAPLLANPAFQKDGLLIITFEESDSTDKAHGGGHVATI